MIGHSNGLCVFYSCDSLGRLNYITRIDCKNRRGKFSSGRKISGINFINNLEILISTNDSRLRIINLEVKAIYPNPNYRYCRTVHRNKSTKATEMRIFKSKPLFVTTRLMLFRAARTATSTFGISLMVPVLY